ncbi:MAG TPA: hypothetical protein VHD87_12765 [Acidimicrobiales bacterium]|nr:hypothetical protein [Acidimicrobiales bacterium]
MMNDPGGFDPDDLSATTRALQDDLGLDTDDNATGPHNQNALDRYTADVDSHQLEEVRAYVEARGLNFAEATDQLDVTELEAQLAASYDAQRAEAQRCGRLALAALPRVMRAHLPRKAHLAVTVTDQDLSGRLEPDDRDIDDVETHPCYDQVTALLASLDRSNEATWSAFVTRDKWGNPTSIDLHKLHNTNLLRADDLR